MPNHLKFRFKVTVKLKKIGNSKEGYSFRIIITALPKRCRFNLQAISINNFTILKKSPKHNAQCKISDQPIPKQ